MSFSSRNRRVLLFDKLTPPLAWIARLATRFGLEVAYVDPVGPMRAADKMRALAEAGVHQIHVADLTSFDAFAPDKVLAKLSAKAVNSLLPEGPLAKIATHFPLVADRRRKVRVLAHHVVMEAFRPHALAYAVAEYRRARGDRCFLWSAGGLIACLLFNRFGTVPVLVPSLPLALGLLVKRLVLGPFRRRAMRSPEAAPDFPARAQAPIDAEVLLFPHKGISGMLYERDQYYSDELDSPFSRKRICHVELADVLPPPGPWRSEVLEGYRIAGIAPYVLNISAPLVDPRQWLKAFISGRRAGLGLLGSLILEVARRRVEQGVAALLVFSNARLALLGYEYLFPVWLAYALQARAVRVVAAQERFFHCLLPGWPVIIDDYFVHGEAAQQRLASNEFACIARTYPAGDVRTEWLTNPLSYERFPGGYNHLTLVLDWHSTPDLAADRQLHTCSWANNKLFYRDVLHLAARFPKCFFLVRGKNADWLDIPDFEDIRREMKAIPNIAVSVDYSQQRIAYALASKADSIIARFTSLGDQALAVGKPVLVHDISANGGPLVSSVLSYEPYFPLATDRDTFFKLYARIVETGDIMSQQERHEMVKHFYSWPPPEEGFRASLHSQLESFLKEDA
jgi:hypothetical protein